MKMRIFLIVVLAVIIAGCAVKGESVEMSKACDAGNDGKTLEVKGVLADDGSVFCSNIGGGRLNCGFVQLESPGSDKKLRVDIEEGTGADTVSKLESGYKKEDIKVRDDAGNQIALNKDVVRATGKMSIVPAFKENPQVCTMEVYKLER